MKIIISTIILLNVMACKNEKIIITREYLYNEYWGTKQSYGVDIYQIELSDSVKRLLNEGMKNMIILRDHKKSDTFAYSLGGDADLTSMGKKVFFNKNQNGIHWKSHRDFSIKRPTIGRLRKNTWYLFERLRIAWDYYVFVDSEGKVHVFPVMPHNI